MTDLKHTALHPSDHPLLRRLANAGRPAAPAVPRADGVPRPPRHLAVFATGTDHLQVCWSALGPGPVRFRVADTDVWVDADGGPGGVRLGGLPEGRALVVRIDGDGLARGRLRLRAETLVPPPGEELYRLATVNDVHIGQTSSGYFHTMVEIPEPVDAHPTRCLRAALADAVDFGAQRIVVKGDLTHASTAANWTQVGALLSTVPVPVDVVPGNHEGSRHSDVEPQQGLAPHGFRLVRGVQVVDLPGIRLISGDSTIAGSDWGQYDRIRDQVLRAAGRTDRPILLGVHHQPMLLGVPTYLPPGVPGPEARAFLRALADRQPATLVTTGHTHRHRKHRYGPVVVTEVGSTKDFPGTWASYQVFEGGIVQVVHRITETSCIRWTDHTRRAAGGVWQLWSPGPLGSRCFSHRWPAR